MPHSHKPDTTKIQDMFNDILSIKEKTEQFGPTCTTGQSSASHNVSNKQIEAVNGNLKNRKVGSILLVSDQTSSKLEFYEGV